MLDSSGRSEAHMGDTGQVEGQVAEKKVIQQREQENQYRAEAGSSEVTSWL